MKQLLIISVLLICAIAFYVGVNSYLTNQSREAQLSQTKKLLSDTEANELKSHVLSDGKSQNRTEIEGLFQNCTTQNNQTDANILNLNPIYNILNYYDQLNQTIYESNKTCNEQIAKLNQTLYEIQPKSIQITNYTNAGICQFGNVNGTYQFASFSYKMIKMPKIAWDYYVFNGELNVTGTAVEIYNCAPPVFVSQKLYHRKVLTQDGFSLNVTDVHVGQGKVVFDVLSPPGVFKLNNYVIY